MKKVTPAKVSSPVAMPFCTPSTKDPCPWYFSASSLHLFSKVSFCLYFFVNKDMDISSGAFYPWKNSLRLPGKVPRHPCATLLCSGL